MKTKAISSIFVLFAIAAGMASMAPDAFADHPEVVITTVDESGNGNTCAVMNGGSGCYTPTTATVDVGGVVTMINNDATGSPHSFTAGTIDGFAQSPSGIFDSGILMADETLEWTATETGTVPYYCMLHVWMVGEIIVQEDSHAAEAAAQALADAEAADAAAQALADAEAAEAAAQALADEEAAEAAALVAEEADAEAADVELMVGISYSEVMGGTQVELDFSELHVNYDMTATQNGEVVFEETGLHSMENIATHQIDAVGSDDNPINVKVESLGIGAPGNSDNWTGPVGQVTTAQVVPEFGTIAMMVLAVAIISIVAVTAKSRVVPRF